MSVVPMKLLTMAGPLERFDEVVRTCVIDQQFHPESTLQMMHGVKGLMALDYSNPYAALLRRAEEVADEAGVIQGHATPLLFRQRRLSHSPPPGTARFPLNRGTGWQG